MAQRGIDIDLDLDLTAWFLALSYMNVHVDKGTMWAMREAGRGIREDGRSRSPVRTGRLRDSIKASRNIRGGGHEFEMAVGPRGPEVAKYSGAQQRRYGFMNPSAGERRISQAMEQAQRRILGRFA